MSAHPPRAQVVVVGDEFLVEGRVDRNGPEMARILSEVGCRVVGISVLPDELDALSKGLEAVLADSTITLVSGGLGPTEDDRTREAVARALDIPMEVDGAVESKLSRRSAARGGGPAPEGARRQASRPRGAQLLPNLVGTAPALVLDSDRSLLFLLPGVPEELERILVEEVVPRVRARLGERLRPIRHRSVHVFGLPESRVAVRAAELRTAGHTGFETATFPGARGVRVRFSARGPDPNFLDAQVADAARNLVELLGPRRSVLLPATGGLAEAVGEALHERAWTLAVAESCTGGLLGGRITETPGASAYFVGGALSYSDPMKEDFLGVRRATLREHGAVSEEVAGEMAAGVAERTGAETGLAVTGVAGPGGGSDRKPVGTVCIAAWIQGKVRTEALRFPGSRERVRRASVDAVLSLLLEDLQATAAPKP